MTQDKSSTKTRVGKHLSFEERIQIQLLKTEGYSNRAIARRLNRAPQTIHNEIKRGTVVQKRKQEQNGKTYIYHKQRYFADHAQENYRLNRMNCGRRYKWLDQEGILDYFDHLLSKKKGYSPDVACFLARSAQCFPLESLPCTTTLYRWIDLGFLKTKNIDLLSKISRQTKKKRVRTHRKVLGNSIEKRPDSVATREEFGHWEIDTVLGIKSGTEPVFLTLTERKTRFEYILKINSKTACAVNAALTNLKKELGNNFSRMFRTITADNGSEFSELAGLFPDKTKVYFSHPYSSWERGTNEMHNRMIRRFIRKGQKISEVSQAKVRGIQQWMNDLPRKILQYRTPHEAFVKELKAIRLSF